MFLVHCPACGQRELRSTRAFSSFRSTHHGVEIAVGCSRCGTEAHLLTGAAAAATAVAAIAPSAATSETGAAA